MDPGEVPLNWHELAFTQSTLDGCRAAPEQVALILLDEAARSRLTLQR